MISSFKKRTLLSAALCVTLLTSCHSGKDGGDAANKAGKSASSDNTKSSASGGSTGGNSSQVGSDGGGSPEDNRSAGLPIGNVMIAAESQAKAGIRIAPASVQRLPQELYVNGQVAMDERHTEHIGARADGVVERVLVLPGDAVRAGQTLAWLHSHSVHETVGALAQAFDATDRQTSAVRFAEINRDRYQKLLQLQSASQEEAQRAEQELKQSQQNLRDAEANVRMEREHLSELLQVSPDSLTPRTLYNRELIPVRAEGAGVVVQRDVTPGQVLTTGQQVFVVSNLSTVWMMAAVNEKDFPQVRRGQVAMVSIQGTSSTPLRGIVDMLGDQLSPETRTVPVRIVVPNPGTRLRPGMFTTARIQLTATTDGIFVPEGAVQDVNGLQAVFVATDPTHFTVRAVTLGEHANGMVHVLQGLSAHDSVVVDGAFMVKGELLKGSVGEG